MSIVSEIKCARCDRKYSGVRSRCPYCGARRIGRGKYSEEADNAKGKMLISVLILAVLVVAAGVLWFTTEVPDDERLGADPPELSIPDDLGTDSVEGTQDVPEPPPPPPPPPEPEEPPLEVRSINITYDGRNREEFTAKVNERVPLRVRIEPPGIEEQVIWESSNKDVFDVVPEDTMGNSATVTGIGTGNATLTVYVGDKEAKCIVRVVR